MSQKNLLIADRLIKNPSSGNDLEIMEGTGQKPLTPFLFKSGQRNVERAANRIPKPQPIFQ